MIAMAAASPAAEPQPLIQGPRAPAQRKDVPNRRSRFRPILLEPPAPIASLFAKAEDGLARRDWKFAIDCLQRIIDDPEGALVNRLDRDPTGTVRFESARRRAIRRLASLPPEGLRAYRLLFDGKAKRLFEQGYEAHDPQPLREVVKRYLLTRYGDDAADLLASWSLDAGRPGMTVALLTDLIELVPDYDIPRLSIVVKLAAAYTLLGRTDQAAAWLGESDAAEFGSRNDDERRSLRSVLDLRLPPFDSEADPGSWPHVGGFAARRGQMPAVEPMLAEAVPWRRGLPGAASDAWRRVLRADPASPLNLPVGQLVSDGRRVFARTRRGCVAFSMEDLAVEWESEAVERAVTRRQSGERIIRRPRTAPVTDAGIGFEDYVAGGIALGHGLVMIISREGRSRYTLAQRDAGWGDPPGWVPKVDVTPANVRGSQLIAYDANTGLIRWQRGRSGHPGDRLGEVEFRSAPLVLEDTIWVPFVRQGDLYVAILDPADGALIQSILLCSVGKRSIAPRHALRPAAADGFVFIPSGRGTLFALDADGYAFRWATQYDAALSDGDPLDSAEQPGWDCTTTVAAGGMVLLAPKGYGALLAFSAESGELKWSVPCGDCAYVIAAGQDRVWVGGRSVSCLSLSDGSLSWDVEIEPMPTGRAVLSGKIVYVPTLDGLLALRATTGEVLSMTPAPVSHGPLGNLLCLGAAMFSLNASSVQKFPDIGRTYPETKARHEANPADPVIAVRLAWLELLRGEPRRAFDVLNHIPPEALQHDAAHADRVAHARVEALLAMAGRSSALGRVDEDVLPLLEQANEAARTAFDRFRCTMAIADQLNVLGRHAEAFRRLWHLGVSSDAERMVPWKDHVEGPIRSAVAARLRTITKMLSEQERRTVRQYATDYANIVEEEVGRASRDGGSRRRLRSVADLKVPGAVSQRAMLELAAFHLRSLQYEQAEQWFRECLRLDAGPALTAFAQLGLCGLYADTVSAGYESHGVLARNLDLLERFGALAIPDRIGEALLPESVQIREERVDDWVRAAREFFLAGDAPVGERGPDGTRAPTGLTNEIAWSLGSDPMSAAPRMVSFGEQRPSWLNERIIVHAPNDEISCYDARDGRLLWKSTLRLLETFQDEPITRWAEGEEGMFHAASDGQTAAFIGRQGIFAVGLGTGRRIWVRPFEPQAEEGASFHPRGIMSAGYGVLAAMPRRGRLTLMRLGDGTTVWERDLLGERIGGIWMSKGRVVTVDPGLQRVHLFNRDDGVLVKRVLFRQPDPRNMLVNLIRTGDVLCGPVSGSDFDAVVAISLTSGELLWETRLEKPLAQMFSPKEGYLGIGLLGGDVRIIEAATGDLVIDRRVSDPNVVVRATLVDGTLVVQQQIVRQGVRTSALAALDVATDTELWRREDVVPLWRMDRPLKVVDGCIPVLLRARRPPVDQRQANRRRAVRVANVDVRTGKVVGEKAVLPSGGRNRMARLTGDFEILPEAGVAIIGTENGIHAVRMESAPTRTEGNF